MISLLIAVNESLNVLSMEKNKAYVAAMLELSRSLEMNRTLTQVNFTPFSPPNSNPAMDKVLLDIAAICTRNVRKKK